MKLDARNYEIYKINQLEINSTELNFLNTALNYVNNVTQWKLF